MGRVSILGLMDSGFRQSQDFFEKKNYYVSILGLMDSGFRPYTTFRG